MNKQIIDTDIMRIMTICNEQDLSEMVFNTIKYYREQAEHWKQMYIQWRHHGMEKANEELIDEISALQERLDLSYGQFASKKEKEAYKNFEQRHMHERLISKIQGGKAPYLIPTGTGIGTILNVVCPICGAREDITDTEGW